MKSSKKYWKLLLGILILLVVIVLCVKTVNDQKDKGLQLAADIVSDVAWGAIGAYLIYSYIKDKDKEDQGIAEQVPVAPNSPEDTERLRITRNNVLAWILLLGVLGSLSMYITNNYRAGLVPENIGVIANVIIDIGNIYFIIALFKANKRPNSKVLNLLFFWITLSFLANIGVDIWKKEWLFIAGDLIVFAYFAFYIKFALTRRNFRIANFIILPLSIIAIIALSSAQSFELGILQSQEMRAEGEFGYAFSDQYTKYAILIQEKDPANLPSEARDLKLALVNKKEKMSSLKNIVEKMKSELNKNKNSSNAELDRKINLLSNIIQLNEQQDSRMEQLEKFLETADVQNYSDEDQQFITKLLQDITAGIRDIQAASLDLLPASN